MFMVLGWEGYSKFGYGFSGIQGTADSVEEAVIGLNDLPDFLGTAQVVHMTSMKVVRQFEKNRKNNKWGLVR